MKREKEDDDNTQKPTAKSTQLDHFAKLIAHVELKQLVETLESNQM